jgi:hypothetical protein
MQGIQRTVTLEAGVSFSFARYLQARKLLSFGKEKQYQEIEQTKKQAEEQAAFEQKKFGYTKTQDEITNKLNMDKFLHEQENDKEKNYLTDKGHDITDAHYKDWLTVELEKLKAGDGSDADWLFGKKTGSKSSSSSSDSSSGEDGGLYNISNSKNTVANRFIDDRLKKMKDGDKKLFENGINGESLYDYALSRKDAELVDGGETGSYWGEATGSGFNEGTLKSGLNNFYSLLSGVGNLSEAEQEALMPLINQTFDLIERGNMAALQKHFGGEDWNSGGGAEYARFDDIAKRTLQVARNYQGKYDAEDSRYTNENKEIEAALRSEKITLFAAQVLVNKNNEKHKEIKNGIAEKQEKDIKKEGAMFDYIKNKVKQNKARLKEISGNKLLEQSRKFRKENPFFYLSF